MKKLIILLSLLVLNENKNKIYCDIKGNINKPGVYEIKSNYTIQDVIEIAGGLKKNSYTKNINLSKKVTDEMVIYIFQSDEINEIKNLKNCTCEPTYIYKKCEKIEIEDTNNTTLTTTSSKKEEMTSSTQVITSIQTTIKETIPTTTTKTTTTEIIPNTTTQTTTKQKEVVNINTASLEELIVLESLGIKKAQSIIEYRTINGPFKTVEDIMKVNGIGESTFEKIKEFIEI